jgi:hypothetical protein
VKVAPLTEIHGIQRQTYGFDELYHRQGSE